jgi:thiosulfate reductase cytochrome b subunit
MHPVGRAVLMLKQYLDMRLSGAPAWQRIAAWLGLVTACLVMIAVGVLTGHYVLSGVGALLAAGVTGQGVAAVRRRWPRSRRAG